MGKPEDELDARVLAELDELVANLPPLSAEQLDQLCDSLAAIRQRCAR